MSEQPIITEDEPSVSPQPICAPNQQNFFKLLDVVEDYDAISTNIRKQYQSAMLELAAIKFSDANCLNVSAHRCVPAFLKVSQQGKLERGYGSFTNPICEQQVLYDEFDDQQEIESTCENKQRKLEELDRKQQIQTFCENELLHRFNVFNQQQQVIAAAHQFQQVLQLLLQLNQCKRSFQQIEVQLKGRL